MTARRSGEDKPWATPLADELDDPFSLDDRPSPSHIVVGAGEDYPDDAPTVAVMDLEKLGIDVTEFGTGDTEPRPPVRGMETRPRTPRPHIERVGRVRRTSPPVPEPEVIRPPPEAVMPAAPTSEGVPTWIFIVAAGLPVVVAIAAAAFLFLGA